MHVSHGPSEPWERSNKVKKRLACFVCGGLLLALCGSRPSGCLANDERPGFRPGRFEAHDSLAPQPDSSSDAQDCLQGLTWDAQAFPVRCEAGGYQSGDAIVRFPSPVNSGHETNDLVAMEWYFAEDPSGEPLQRAPAVIVVHESGSGMTVGRLIAQGLRKNGLHTFLIHLPYYGLRREGRSKPPAGELVTIVRQAIADVRRARDAVSVLPTVDPRHVALQGTSLGGFVAATCAGLDKGFDSVFIVLAGGNLYEMLESGQKDAAKARAELARAGLSGATLKQLLYQIEPTRVAHRIPPDRMWLYSGTYDTVVPIQNAEALADCVHLAPTHHIRMRANHYSGVIYLPFVLKHIAQRVKRLHAAAPAGTSSQRPEN